MTLPVAPSPHRPAHHAALERLVRATLLWLACGVLLSVAPGCGQAQTSESTAAPNAVEPPAAAPVAAPAGVPSGLDLSSFIRRVHFAFRPEADAWTGGHATYAVRVSEQELRVTPYSPVSGPPAPGSPSVESIPGAPFVAATKSIDRGGKSILGASRGVSLQDDSILLLDRGGVTENLQNTEEGVEQSFTFHDRPAGQGDVTVRLAVSGQTYTGATEHGLHFVDPQTGLGVRYGVATWIDASGHPTGLQASFDGSAIVVTVPADVVDKSAYPAVLDPTVGPEIGTDNPIHAAAINDQSQTAMAYGSGSYLVVWTDARFGTNEIYGARVTTAGTVLDTSGIPVAVAKGQQSSAAIAFDGTNWMVTWSDTRNASGGDIYAARVSTSGSVLDPNGIVVASGNYRVLPSIAYDGTNHFITYINNSGVGTVQGNFVSPAGTVTPTAVTVTSQSGGIYAQAVSYNGTNYLVAIEYYLSPYYRVGAKRVTPGGTVLDAGEVQLAGTSGGYLSIGVASDGVNWLVAWNPTSTNNVYGARVSSAGVAMDGTGFLVGSTTSFNGTAIQVAFAGNGYGVFWDAAQEIYGARVSSGGAVFVPATALVNETGASNYPAAAHDGTNFLVAFRDTRLVAGNNPADIFGLRVSNALAKVDMTSFLLSQAANSQFRPAVAYNGTNYLVVWDDTRPGTTSDIYGARISATGTVLDASGLVLSQAANSQISPSVASNGTDWLVAWRDSRGADLDIYGTRVQANGNVLEPTGLQIAGGGTTQDSPAVGSDGTNYLVTWAVSSGDVYGARVTAAGAVLDPSGFAISTGGGSLPALAYNGTNYLVAWTKPTNSNDIFGARVTPAGTVLDAGALSIPVAANVGVAETNAAVSSNGTTWLVVWNDSSDVRGARVNAAGTVLDPVGIGISAAANVQSFPDTSWDGSQYWVVWQDDRTTSTYTDIYASRMTSAGVVTDSAGLAVSTDALQSELRPVIAAGKPKENLVAYYRFDPLQPYGATRVRSRLVTDPAPGANGTPCTMAGQCTSGFCVDGVCCDLACGGVCQACTAAKKGAGGDGTCGTIKVDTDPDSECTDQGAPTCGTTGNCNGAGACKLYASGTDCGAVCAGNSVQDKTCDGAGVCANSGAPMDCAPYACSAGACKTSCMTSADCASGYNCNGNVCGSALPNGSACATASQCLSGFCVDAVCCNSSCTGLCQACSAAKKGTGSDGTCGPVTTGADPDSECTQAPQNTCGQTGSCNGSGACELYASGTSCGSPICQGDILKPQTCDGLGTCAPSGMGQNCAPYACVSGACKTSCVANSDCATGYVCGLGVCVPPTADGGACNVSSECLSGFCIDGVCCNTACTGLCQACTFAKKGNGTDGVCGPVSTGADPDNECATQSPSSCGQTGQCNGAGVCQLYAQGISCGTSICQGNTVTGQICNGSGLCVNDPVGQNCAPYVCSGGACKNPCMSTNECIAGYLCVNGACQQIGGPGTPCANGLECQSGFCVESVCCSSACTGTCVACSAAKKGQGTDGVCEPIKSNTDPDNECAAQAPTTCGQSGLCNGMGACGLYPTGTTCSPQSCTGSTQTNASQCDGQGVCTPGSTIDCVEGYVCTGDACATGCTDDTSCAPGYHCDTGFGYCAPGDPPDAGTDGGASTGTGGAAGSGATGTGGNGGTGTGGNGGTASSGTGGNGGTASGSGTSGSAAGGASSGGSPTDEGGCGCRTAGSESPSPAGMGAMVLLTIAARLRRRRHAKAPAPAARSRRARRS